MVEFKDIQTGADLYFFIKGQLGAADTSDKNFRGSVKTAVDRILEKLPEDCFITRKGIETLELSDEQAAYLMLKQSFRHRPKLFAIAQQQAPHGIGNILDKAVTTSQENKINIWPDWLDAENLVTRSLPSDGEAKDITCAYEHESVGYKTFSIEMATIEKMVINTIEEHL
ncbi:hypothetical protein ACFL6C_14705, partial [Myxococcota bacterium]